MLYQSTIDAITWVEVPPDYVQKHARFFIAELFPRFERKYGEKWWHDRIYVHSRAHPVPLLMGYKAFAYSSEDTIYWSIYCGIAGQLLIAYNKKENGIQKYFLRLEFISAFKDYMDMPQ